MDSIRSTVITLIFTVLAAAAAQPAAASRGCDDILTPEFILEEIVDLGQELFSGAAELLAGGDSAACREAIVGVFLSEGSAARFGPWPAREDAIRRARLFLDDKYMLGVHPGYLLKGDLRWNENPAGSANWEFNLLALDVLANATQAFIQTGDRKFIDKGVKLILDFHSDNLDNMNLPSPYSWYDHSVAYRTIHMIDFWNEYMKLEERDERFVLAFLELVWRQGLYLEKDKYYSNKTNHGIYSNIAQLRLALAFPQLKGAALWKKAALERMEGQILDNYTAEGIHREYSPSYHVLTTKLLCRFRDDCATDETIELPASFDSLIVKARRNIAWLVHPEGKLSLIGDSSLGTAATIIGSLAGDDPALEWILTEGKNGSPPDKTSIRFKEAQLFVMRSGWGVERDPGDESYLIADFCPRGKAHQHNDYLAFEFSSLGVRWFTDLGVFNYNMSDAGRKFVISASAHNLIVPFENTRRFTQSKNDIPTRSAETKEDDKFEAMLDHIETIEEALARVDALLQLREKADGRSESRILLMLALSYEALGNNSDKARACLQEIIDKGRGSGYKEIAVQLIEMLDVRVEDIEFDDSSDMDIHDSGGKTPDGPLLTEMQARPSASGRKATKESNEDPKFGLVSSRSALRPDHGQRPVIHFWIEEDDYCYLEGSYQYSKQFRHGRAFLFIRPGILILVDRVRSTGELSFSEFFHLPPEVTAEKTETGYLLAGPGVERCVFSCLMAPLSAESRVIKGQRHPELQGWYSGTFDNFEPAPVIEYSFQPESRGSYYFVHIVMPVLSGDLGEAVFARVVSGRGGEWNPEGGDPLELTIGSAGETITVFFSPSAAFTGAGGSEPGEPPRIEITGNER